MAFKSDMPSTRRDERVVDNNNGRSDDFSRDATKHTTYTSFPSKESPSPKGSS